MGKSVPDAMSSNPCTIDADQPVAFAAKKTGRARRGDLEGLSPTS
jgi:hypothetical protein